MDQVLDLLAKVYNTTSIKQLDDLEVCLRSFYGLDPDTPLLVLLLKTDNADAYDVLNAIATHAMILEGDADCLVA